VAVNPSGEVTAGSESVTERLVESGEGPHSDGGSLKMKAPTTLLHHPGRATAAVGAVVAVSATTLMVLLSGTAAATEPGRCTDNVNVRAEPDINSDIVALCEAGTEVMTGETRNGFVRLTDLGGWSAKEYISVGDGAASTQSSPEQGAGADTPGTPYDGTSGDGTSGGSGGSGTSGGSGDGDTATTPAPGSSDDPGASGDSGSAGDAAGSGSTSGDDHHSHSGDDSSDDSSDNGGSQPAPESGPLAGLLG
jgi:hypothetical protein